MNAGMRFVAISALAVAGTMCFCRASGASVPVVTLTFDDNPKGHVLHAAPVLERHGYKGTFCIVTSWIGTDAKRMTWDDVRELKRRGHEIVSHTVTHADLLKTNREKGDDAVRAELTGSRDAIRRETGAAPRFLCYPFGQKDDRVDAMVRSAGMIPMGLRRINFGTGTTPASFARYLDSLIAGKNPAPVDILFHGITAETGGWRPFASLADFEGCIAALAEREKKGLIKVVDYNVFAGRGRGRLCLTFDDRNWPRWVAAMPIFAKYGARASFFPDGRLNAEALAAVKLLYDAGHTVGPHTVKHRNAPAYVAEHGFDEYWKKEVQPQMADFASAGIRPRSMAYPNNRHSAETDAGFVARGIERLRAGVPGSRPYDPKGLKRETLVPFPELDAMYLTEEYVRTNAVMPGVGIGSAYNTDIDDFCAGLRRAAARNETVVVFSHDIAPEANAISMKTGWLKRILETASREKMTISGFDDLPRLDSSGCRPMQR